MTVTKYRDRFLQLARYAPAEVANDGDKQERFREGLDDHLEYALMNHRFDNFNHLVDSTLNTERKHREIEDKKRKMAPAVSGSNSTTSTIWLTPPSTPSASTGRLRTRRGRWLLLRLAATLSLDTSTRSSSSSRGHLRHTIRDSSSTRLIPSSSRRDRARGFQHLWHAQLHRLHQLSGRECLLLLPDSRLQHSHGHAITAASRDTTPTLVPGRRSLDSRAPSSAQGAITGQGEPRAG
jgi:hypothetical protein